MSRLLLYVAEFWCIHVHDQVLWPFRGSYRCRKCLREYPVSWAPPPRNGSSRPRSLQLSVAGARRAA